MHLFAYYLCSKYEDMKYEQAAAIIYTYLWLE